MRNLAWVMCGVNSSDCYNKRVALKFSPLPKLSMLPAVKIAAKRAVVVGGRRQAALSVARLKDTRCFQSAAQTDRVNRLAIKVMNTCIDQSLGHHHTSPLLTRYKTRSRKALEDFQREQPPFPPR